ncbi:hypothetical protein ENUP19_0286G0004 [Entamoeba nuttalli]|uniref:Uncharacterized protein n=1 Tax=Entamoeba nuttalli TaxID=412467 RepID=A0ABQ0DI03_9EUKA
MQTAYKINRNYQVSEQGIMLVLLNQFADIELEKKKKKATKALPFLQIRSINFGNGDVFNFNQFIECRCKELIQSEIQRGLKEETASKRYNCYLINESIHLLIDLLNENRIQTSSSFSAGKNGRIKTETIDTIRYNSSILDKNFIKEKGVVINEYLAERLHGEDSIIFHRNCYELQHLLV